MANGNWKRQCLDEVERLGAELCDWASHCALIQSEIDTYCSGTDKIPGTPVPQVVDGKLCYCCCSCFAYDTPIETAQGIYTFIQDIQEGDTVLTTGLDLKWKETKVLYSSGLGPDLHFPFMYYLIYQMEGEELPRDMIVTADHLFLMASEQKGLKPVQNLIPGDKLCQANGGVAEVVFCLVAGYTGGVHHIHTGPFDGVNLDGHLLNANGVVCSDYMVQLSFFSNQLDASFVESTVAQGNSLEVGTAEYNAQYSCREAEEFLASPHLWPKGVKLNQRTPLINVPLMAASFLTKAQAEDIQANGEFVGYGNPLSLDTIKYLFQIYQGFSFSNGIQFLTDWDNDLPNAYTWEKSGQKIVLVTGGLLRTRVVNRDGLALILAHLLAVINGKKCVGEADYAATIYLREVWNNDLYASVCLSAIEEMKKLFVYVSEENARENPDNICAQPSLYCRVKTFESGLSFMGIPDCAISSPRTLEVEGAQSSQSLSSVMVSFNQALNPPTAETASNYYIEPNAEVIAAELLPTDSQRVRLLVKGLMVNSNYVLTVSNVISWLNAPLDPEKNTASFHTGHNKSVGIRAAML